MQLVDTNIVSELVRSAPNLGVLRWLEQTQERNPQLSFSAITLEEIIYGVSRKPSARLQHWCEDLIRWHQVLPVTEKIASRAGQLRAHFAAIGSPRTQADMLIAATAQEHGLCLVTRNTRDFDGCGIALLDPFA
jgi:toxin FitB